MRPRTTLERRVEALAASVRDLTPAQREWGLSNIIPHYCIYRTRSHKATCVDCGHTWTEKNPRRCPCCGRRLTLKPDNRQRRFTERRYYSIVQRKAEFTLIRIFYIFVSRKVNDPNVVTSFTEVLQHWISEDGKDTIRALRIAMFPYYRVCPYSLDSDLSLKRDRDWYGYRNAYYHICPDGYYPRMRYSDTLRRNGFKGDFRGICPEDALQLLLTDNRFETLWKLGMQDVLEYYVDKGSDRIVRYWRQVLQINKTGYAVRDVGIWLDYLDLLEYFHKDIGNPCYLFPEDLDKEHDRLVKKKMDIEERLEMERRKQEEKDKIAVLESKSPYFGITFGNGHLSVIVLKTLEDYKREGDLQHHCVYTNGYYGKKDTLILSARMDDAPQKPVETVEISLDTGKILQCFGPCNGFTEHHDEIRELVSKNSYRFKRVRR
jgi:hypothetical protein